MDGIYRDDPRYEEDYKGKRCDLCNEPIPDFAIREIYSEKRQELMEVHYDCKQRIESENQDITCQD